MITKIALLVSKHTLKLRDLHTFMYSQNYQSINSHQRKIGGAKFLKSEHGSKQRQYSGGGRVPTRPEQGTTAGSCLSHSRTSRLGALRGQ